ncbi:calmodulin-binding transcription activator 2 isoform X2 [Lycium ferocissimum]|uniref:calmodulin-binding transcription activator 2 isoform X2 n=1 Tax=Lycium ferocissimum TaxID=112874 RepID=UPI002814D9EC|nr:calmodulin-binding transcription activator 2 isoform X2 [Lycium ferocissimum]
MADCGLDPPGFRLDITQILSEVQHRWLRPAEICEILRNYRKFHITPEAPYRPVSGSVFLFDRKVLRYFRKDGHNWRKKKDGKTVKEAHEKLKVGSIDVLHCYYAHGEEDDNFQRRCYWMLEQDLMHIVFVHYLEVKGNKVNASCIRSAHSNYLNEGSLSDSFPRGHKKLASANADSTSLASSLTEAHEEAESEDSHQACSKFHSYSDRASGMYSHLVENRDTICSSYGSPQSSVEYTSLPGTDEGGQCGFGNFASGPQRTTDLGSQEPVSQHCSNGEMICQDDLKNNLSVHGNWRYSFGDSQLQFHGQTVNQDLIADTSYDLENSFHNKNVSSNLLPVRGQSYLYPDEQEEQLTQLNLQYLNSLVEVQGDSNQENSVDMLGLGDYSTIKQPHLSSVKMEVGLKKVDSFSRWVAKELEDVQELHMQPTNQISWNAIDTEDDGSCLPSQLHVDSHSLDPSLSQEQVFSIIDFSPNWAYSNLETKVLITGRFLKSEGELVEYKWSCMFGEVEVPAEVLAEGVLRCHAPPHKPGVLPFYVTCSNRLACSEVREFEYRFGPYQEFGTANDSTTEMHLLERIENLLSLGPVSSCHSFDSMEAAKEKQSTVNKIIFMMEEENQQMIERASDSGTSQCRVKADLFLERKLKQNFYAWLVHQVTGDGRGRTVLDDEGQGVLHLVAALGYDWALKPILASGVSVDFRDMNGWTALHWAAFYGREKTVVGLVSLGASPGALTDPSAEFHLGRTPADLASANGHKGISGFLAESSLTTHLSKLTVTDAKEEIASEVSGANVGETVTERVAVTTTGDDVPDVLSLKDSLAAIRNATQAAARIHQIFRVQSFQRKQIIEHSDNGLSSDENALSIVASRASKLGKNNGIAHAAAIQIQKKFRGWNKRKEFLLIRQKIVKIQAHIRGHQVRKKYKPIIWSVGILEKVILRWRRKRSGLRGFKSEVVMNKPSTQDDSLPEDDYDFLKEGRKQTEVRMQKALSRVKSMTQYPEGRAQYRRLLTAAEGLREAKDGPSQIPEIPEDSIYPEEELFDVESLLDDDTFMSIAFE